MNLHSAKRLRAGPLILAAASLGAAAAHSNSASKKPAVSTAAPAFALPTLEDVAGLRPRITARDWKSAIRTARRTLRPMPPLMHPRLAGGRTPLSTVKKDIDNITSYLGYVWTYSRRASDPDEKAWAHTQLWSYGKRLLGLYGERIGIFFRDLF